MPQKNKHGVYIEDSIWKDMQGQAARLDRSMSWMLRKSWEIAKWKVEQIPSHDDVQLIFKGETEGG